MPKKKKFITLTLKRRKMDFVRDDIHDSCQKFKFNKQREAY